MGAASIKPLTRDHPVYELVNLNKQGGMIDDAALDLCVKLIISTTNHYLIVYTSEGGVRSASTQIADLIVSSGNCLPPAIRFEVYEVPKIDQLNLDKPEPRREEVLNYEYVTTRDGKETRINLRSLLGLFGNVHLVDRTNCCLKLA